MDFNLMFYGRVIFGIGCGAMYVGQSAIVSEWFINYELPLSMSMVSAFPLIASFGTGIVVPPVYNEKGFGPAFNVGFIICLVCLGEYLLLFWLDYKVV